MTAIYGADATGSNYPHLPKGMLYAGYTTGSGGIAWTSAQWNAHPDALRICQDPGATDHTADVLDVESGAATPADCAPWAKAALVSYHSAARPGQRSPAIYCSQSNVTSVVNALTAGGVKSGVGLFIANWNLTKGAATAALGNSGGPFPVIGYQYSDAGLYDLDVWLYSWVNDVSKKGAVMDVPPGQWNDPATWTWKEASVIGVGLDGNLHVFTLNLSTGKWVQSE